MKNRANDADALTVEEEADSGDSAVAMPDEFREALRVADVRAVGVNGETHHFAGPA
jgi:hypothetical protein